MDAFQVVYCTSNLLALHNVYLLRHGRGHNRGIMNDFSVHGDSFEDFIAHQDSVLMKCEYCNLVLNCKNTTL